MRPRDIPVRFSNLKHFAKSAAHYRHAIEHERADTAAFKLGRLVHFLVLGGNYVVYQGERRGHSWTEFEGAHDGVEIFTRSEADKARPIADAVLSHPAAARLLEGEHERELTWTRNGRDCAGRLDVLHPDRVVDLKTASDAHPERFQRGGLRLGYHAQLAWYLHGVDGCIRREGYTVVVETVAPHVVTILRLTERALEMGDRLNRLWLEQLLVCEASDYWPGYVEGIVPFDVPDMDELSLTIDGEEYAA